jgi:hypothetical protein
MIGAREQRLLERLEKALAVRGTQTVNDVIQAARSGRAQLWEGGSLLLVTEVEDYPLYRVLRYASVAGDMNMEDLNALQARADAWGREQGCTRAEAIGRPGWDRHAKDWLPNWERVGSFWMKDLRQ